MKRILIYNLLLLLVLACTTSAQLATSPDILKRTFSETGFIDRFIGSYAALAQREPSPKPEEIKLLKELVELIPKNSAKATELLEAQVNSGSSGMIQMVLANLYFQAGRLPEAAGAYQKCILEYPEFLRAHKNLGLLYLQQGELDKALTALSRSVELGDNDGRTFGLIGYCLLNKGKFLPAETAYRQAVLNSPKNLDWTAGLAQTLYNLAKYEEALALFKDLAAEDPDEQEYWSLMVNVYLNLGDDTKAASNLEIIRRMGQASPENLALLGDIYLNKQAFSLALEAYQEALKTGDGLPAETPLRTVDILYTYGSYQLAEQLIEDIRVRYRDSLDKEQAMKLLTIEAGLASARGDEDTARQSLEQIVEQDATQAGALIELARMYYKQARKLRIEMATGDTN
ncbi:MAG: tetratricopeptide repeat protein, partial [Verrucomicrobiota bacterium]|nr:tetratricopeptide repeat protein [Verrucomicrobiota bacterium]